MAACAVLDAIMIQASRSATANLLPPITTLPPTMVRPPLRFEAVGADRALTTFSQSLRSCLAWAGTLALAARARWVTSKGAEGREAVGACEPKKGGPRRSPPRPRSLSLLPLDGSSSSQGGAARVSRPSSRSIDS